MSSMSLPPFLAKLQTITESCDPRVAGWNQDGSEFEIRSPRFESEVLKRHFKGSKNTFIRQLHFYCFKKLDSKGHEWAFSHPKFMRDMPHLIFEIKRKTRTEAPGPASRDEVQALRTEMVAMRNEMTALKAQVAALAPQHLHLHQPQHMRGPQQLPLDLLRQQALQALNALPVPVSFAQNQSASSSGTLDNDDDDARFSKARRSAGEHASVSSAQRAPMLQNLSSSSSFSSSSSSSNSGAHTRKRARDAPAAPLAPPSAAPFLPFEDGAHPANLPPAPPGDADSDSGPRKAHKELGADFADLELDEISDLFSAWDAESLHLSQSQSQDAPPPPPQQQEELQLQQQQASSNTSSNTSNAALNARIRVHKSPVRTADLPVPAFAGFISKFVEHAQLLNQAGVLTGDLDPELEIFVHASLPADSPLKDMLLYATPLVRTVLVNALSELEATGWQSAAREAMGPYDARGGASGFLHRVFMVFEADNGFRKDVTGEQFLYFLSFVLKAALTDDGRSSLPPMVNDAGMAAVFDPHLAPRVRRVMHLAHVKIEEWKLQQQTAQQLQQSAGAPTSVAA